MLVVRVLPLRSLAAAAVAVQGGHTRREEVEETIVCRVQVLAAVGEGVLIQAMLVQLLLVLLEDQAALGMVEAREAQVVLPVVMVRTEEEGEGVMEEQEPALLQAMEALVLQEFNGREQELVEVVEAVVEITPVNLPLPAVTAAAHQLIRAAAAAEAGPPIPQAAQQEMAQAALSSLPTYLPCRVRLL